MADSRDRKEHKAPAVSIDTQKEYETVDRTADAIIALLVTASGRKFVPKGPRSFQFDSWMEMLEAVDKEKEKFQESYEDWSKEHVAKMMPTLPLILPVLVEIQKIVYSDEFRFKEKDRFWQKVLTEIEREGQYGNFSTVLGYMVSRGVVSGRTQERLSYCLENAIKHEIPADVVVKSSSKLDYEPLKKLLAEACYIYEPGRREEEEKAQPLHERQIQEFLAYAIRTLKPVEGKLLKTEPTLIKFMKDVLEKGKLDKKGQELLGLDAEPELKTSGQIFAIVVELAKKAQKNSVAEPICQAIIQAAKETKPIDRLRELEKSFLPLLDAKRKADAAAQSKKKKKPVVSEKKKEPPMPPL